MRTLLLFLLLATTSLLAEDQPAGLADLKIGDPAPEFSLPGIDDKTHSLAEYKSAKLLLIAFISNHCPDSHASEERIKKLVSDLRDQSFQLVAINPNNPDGLRLDELGYSKYNDGFDDMKKYAAEQGFNFPYLYDGETQAVAKAYGCLATPHVFIFDEQRKLRYKGQFDDSRYADPATVKTESARQAIDALLAGKPVPVEITKPHGCSTKWMEKKQSVTAATQKWAQTPVDLETIDAAGVAALRKNGTKKFRLFNVWSTTCVPCVREFPELVTTAHKFGLRDFELITLSMDEAKDLPKAKAFLEKQGSGLLDRQKPSLKAENRTTNSYLFAGATQDEMMKVLDPEWPGGMPHTVLVSPKRRNRLAAKRPGGRRQTARRHPASDGTVLCAVAKSSNSGLPLQCPVTHSVRLKELGYPGISRKTPGGGTSPNRNRATASAPPSRSDDCG